jgi:hypothetical protein
MRGAVSLKLTHATVPSGRAQSAKTKVFHFSKLQQVCKIQNALLCCSKNFQTLHECVLTHYEQLSVWKQCQIRNIILIKNPGS